MPNPDLTIVAISNKEPTEKNCYAEFLASARKYGYEPVIIGGDPGEYGGLGTRPRILKRAIEQGRVPTKYLLFSDAWDVVFAQSPDEALARFLGFEAGIVWNSEKNCFPDAWLADKHPPVVPYRFLNSGFGVGETSIFLASLRDMHADEITGDYTNLDGARINPCCQNYWMREFLFGRQSIRLDYNCTIAQTMHLVDEDELSFEANDKIRNKLFRVCPVAFHFNGNAREQSAYDRVLKHLGYRE